jgi:hypothetical protein
MTADRPPPRARATLVGWRDRAVLNPLGAARPEVLAEVEPEPVS